jgi:dynein heavy chain
MTRFREQIIQIEEIANQFIDSSFRKLRSAEGAFDLIQNIKNIRSRESINKKLMGKWYEILEQYSREVDAMESLFRNLKSNPPIQKNQPKVAGAILWSRSLFYRIKGTILRFKSFPEILNTEPGKAVTKKYLAVAKTMREHDEQIFFEWCRSVEAKSSQYLKECVLVQEKTDAGPNDQQFHRLLVNFKPELREIIKETKYLEKMGFGLPETALNIALQENKYHSCIESLEAMIHEYHTVLDHLDPAETNLLKSHLTELKRVISPGLTRLNWNSLGISNYIQRCNQEISKLQGLLNHVKKNSQSIADVVQEISHAVLITMPRSHDEVPEAHVNVSMNS